MGLLVLSVACSAPICDDGTERTRTEVFLEGERGTSTLGNCPDDNNSTDCSALGNVTYRAGEGLKIDLDFPLLTSADDATRSTGGRAESFGEAEYHCAKI